MISFNESCGCMHHTRYSYMLLLLLLLLLLRCFSRVRLCATPRTAAHQAPPSLGFSRQEHWSGLPFPSPLQLLEVLNGWTLGQNVTIKYFLLSLFLATYSLLLIQHLFNISGTQMSNDSFWPPHPSVKTHMSYKESNKSPVLFSLIILARSN